MSILKCKMCGGSLSVDNDSGIAVCEFCGTRQTVSKTSDDVISNLYNRANNLRLKNEFDKAQSIYEKIVEQDDSESEAHWGLVLCKYGIEYVDDPLTKKKIPTCHRTSYESIKNDIDYQAAIDYADPSQQLLYEEEAREIDRLQKEILNIAKNEKPFDVFICYKETDEDGKRTIDSVIANDIYHQLTQEGFKVFYAVITLEDKLGQEYEPYIFAALNSAKVMLVIGTKPQYFDAVWVKNEWSRYLSLMKTDRSRILIPCYRDMDAYDLPDEFAHLQAQDMSKIGFINDVIRGIRKIVVKEDTVQKKAVPVLQNISQSSVNNDSLLKRAHMFLEDGDYSSADEYFDRILDNDPENGEAYLGKLLVEKQFPSLDALVDYYKNLYDSDETEKVNIVDRYQDHINDMVSKYTIKNYLDDYIISEEYKPSTEYTASLYLPCRLKQKQQILDEFNNNRILSRAYSYASDNTKNKLYEIFQTYDQRIEQAKQDDDINTKDIIEKCDQFISSVDQEIENKHYEASNKRENDYHSLIVAAKQAKTILEIKNIEDKLNQLDGYKESRDYVEFCRKRAIEIDNEQQRKTRIRIVIVLIIALLLILLWYFYSIVTPMIKYNKAISLYENGDYISAYTMFGELGEYGESSSYKEKVFPEYLKQSLNDRNVDTIIFGSYEQDNNIKNGAEVIEWRILAREKDKMLIVSKYALDLQQFNTEQETVSWETCSLRTWLNSEFLDNAFSESEAQYISLSTITADENPEYLATKQGNDTVDKIFLLSINEVQQYFESDNDRQCKATTYALGSQTPSRYWCWTRTSGTGVYRASYIGNDGEVSYYGAYVDYPCGVCPALWIEP